MPGYRSWVWYRSRPRPKYNISWGEWREAGRKCGEQMSRYVKKYHTNTQFDLMDYGSYHGSV